MKEMTVEQKAEAYNKAIAHAKILLKTIGNATLGNLVLKNEFKSMFPELRESDDERIRNWLISTLKSLNSTAVQIDGAYEMILPSIAWLEKQGEQSICKTPSREIILAIWDLGNEWKELTNGSISTEHGTQLDYIQKHWQESEYYLRAKQGEQKPNPCDGCVNRKGCINCENGELREVEQKPAAWSEEDERIYKVIAELLNSWSNGTIGGCVIPPNTDRYINWFKSLKNRVQPKQEWSEDDVNTLNSIINYLEEASGRIALPNLKENYIRQIDWLKSLRPQPHWKPSDKQMKALHNVFNDTSAGWEDSVIESLYNDLNKLRGE